MGEDVKVYISSTYEDLKDYRDAVMKALRKIEAQHVNMEDYYAKDDRPVDVCLADVAKCDIYVGIFARRYGFIPDDYTQSITELEYRKAVELNKPTFNFLLKDEVDWPNQYCAIDNDKRWLNKLKDELKGKKTVAWFTGCHDLAQEVMAAVAGHQKKIIRLQIGKGMSDQFANLGVADTPEKKAAIEDVLVASKEKMWQSSNRQLQTWCEPIPVPLPKLRGTFVGRETEQETLLHCLNYTDKRLVVIIAPGGYGKTELTTKVLREIAPKTTITNKDIQGILYLRCSIAGDVNMGTVFTEAGKIAGTVEAFFNVYKNREISNAKRLEYFFKELSIIGNVWIVLDNFEDLLDADDTIKDAELREFLETAVSIDHTIRIIITSRVLPKFKGDRLVEKIDLSEGLPEEKAVEYLRKEGAEYGLRDEDKSILLAFVRRVHRIPKALESGIGYLSEHFPGIKLKDILANDGIFLDFDKHDHKEGLKSLIMEQIKRLHPNLQLVLSVLSIFSKPTPQEALRYMLQGMSYVELAQNLTRLERNRLITHNNGNYDMHPVVRELVYDMIPQNTLSSNEDAVGNNGKPPMFSKAGLHIKAAEFFENIRKPESDWKTIDDLEPQLQEIYHQIRAENYEAAARMLNIIDFNYLRLWGYHGIVIESRQQFIGKLQNKELVGMNFGRLGSSYWNIGRASESIKFTKQALQIAMDNNDKILISASLGNLGIAYYDMGETTKAIDYDEKALAIAKEIGNRKGEGVDLGNLGDVYLALGEISKAIDYYKQAIEISKGIGDRRNEGDTLGCLGNAYFSLNDTEAAVKYSLEALKIGKKIETPLIITKVLTQIAYTYQYDGNLVNAEKYYRESLEYDFPVNTCHSLVYLGVLLLEKKQTVEAQDFIDRGITICRDILEKTPKRFSQLYTLALALLSKGNVTEALEMYKEAIATCPAKGVLQRQLMTLDLLDRAVPECHGVDEAQRLLTEAQA